MIDHLSTHLLIYLFIHNFLLSRPATRGDAYADETKGNDDQGRVHTQSHHSSILPRWFTSNKDDNDNSNNDGDIDTLHMTDNPILLSPDRLKGKHKIVRWGGGNDNNSSNNNNNMNMNSNNKLNHLSSLHKLPTHDIENSSNSGSEVNSDYYYDSDDHDCYGGKSVYDVGSENSDQLNYSQNYGIASVKIANKKAHDEAKLRNATANAAAKNNNLSDLEDQRLNNNNMNNNNNNTNNFSNISHISSGVSTTIAPSNVHQKKHNNEIFRSPERNNKIIEITPSQSELPKSMIFEMNKKMNNQMNFIRNNTVNQRIIINKNDNNITNNTNTNFTNNNTINSVNINGNNGNNNGSSISSNSSKSNENNTGNVIEIIPDNGVSLFHGDNKLTNNNNNNNNSNNITNMTVNTPNTRVINSEQKFKLPNIQTSSQNFNDQNDPENAWLSVPLDDEKSPSK